MSTGRTILHGGLLALGSLAMVWLMGSVLFGVRRASDPSGRMILSWIVFGGGLAGAARAVRPRAAMVAGPIVLGLALVGLVDADPSPVTHGWYGWVAAAVLITNGVAGMLERRGDVRTTSRAA